MKLKKIASLMLAGVMAVSMLAGCNGAESNGTTNDDATITTPASAASTTLYDAMNKEARNLSTAANNSKLDAALKDAVDNFITDAAVITVGNNTQNFAYSYLTNAQLGSKVIDAMEAKAGIAASLNVGNDKAKTGIDVYAFGYGVSDQMVLEWVADEIDDYVANLPTTNNVSGTVYEYDYTVSASVATKTVTNSVGYSVTVKVVAVAVTQTPVKA